MLGQFKLSQETTFQEMLFKKISTFSNPDNVQRLHITNNQCSMKIDCLQRRPSQCLSPSLLQACLNCQTRIEPPVRQVGPRWVSLLYPLARIDTQLSDTRITTFTVRFAPYYCSKKRVFLTCVVLFRRRVWRWWGVENLLSSIFHYCDEPVDRTQTKVDRPT